MNGNPDRIDKRIQKQAFGRLSELMDQARRDRMTGSMSVTVHYNQGVPQRIRHLIDATNN